MQLNDLALFGGSPVFADALHVGRPNLGDRDAFMRRMNDIWDRRWLSNNGPYVRELEQRVADHVGVKHCIAVCNGTIALEIAIRALGLAGEVIVPSFTFIATAHALQWQEITPVFGDVDAQHNLDPDQVEALITPRTTGIIGVHLFGRPCQVERLQEIADWYHLRLMYDASHAFGCTYRGQRIGSFGDAEVFSFHATKFVNAFEGGAIVTNSDEVAHKCHWMKNFGFSDYDLVTHVGTNGKMTEVSAAMGLTSLESLEGYIDHNRSCYHLYRQLLRDVPGVRVIDYDEREACNYQYIILRIDEQVTGISRDGIVRVLHGENVLARRYFYPGCHAQEPYRSYYPHAKLLLPETLRLTEEVLALPTGTAVGPAEIGRICDLLRLILANGPAISRHLSDKQHAESLA